LHGVFRYYQWHFIFTLYKSEGAMTKRTTGLSKLRDLDKPSRGANAANRINLTKTELDKLATSNHHAQKLVWDSKERHLCVLVSRGPKHAKRATVTFRVVYYLPSRPGKPQYMKIGRWPDEVFQLPWKEDGKTVTIKCSDVAAVRLAASNIYNRARTGKDPRRPEASDVFADVVTTYLATDKVRRQRTFKATKRILDVYVTPEWQYRKIGDIRRSDVRALIAKIASGKIKGLTDKIGTPAMANAAYAQLSALFSWYAIGADDFLSPLTKGLAGEAAEGKPKDRSRVLSDDELRAMWPLLNDGSAQGRLIMLGLLTAQRFRKVMRMRWSEIGPHKDLDGALVWDPTSETDPDNKKPSVVPLPALAQDILNGIPRIDDCDFVFTWNGHQAIRTAWDYQQRLNKQLNLPPWQLRDLRRTARTLMSRAGVAEHIAERCLGHKLRGVAGIYNRYDFLREKVDAFERLAHFLDRIVNPPADNVVPLHKQTS
jgi:integrase